MAFWVENFGFESRKRNHVSAINCFYTLVSFQINDKIIIGRHDEKMKTRGWFPWSKK